MMSNMETLMRNLPGEADAAIVTGALNRRYLTGMTSSAGTLLLTREKARFIIDSRYHELARRTVACDVQLQGKLYKQIADFLKECGAKTLAIENDVCTVADLARYREKLPGVTILENGSLTGQIWKQRRVKSEEELAAMRKAQATTDQVFAHILTVAMPGKTEREIAFELEFKGRSLGADNVSFPFIVSAGKNSSMPHAVPGDNVIQRGDFLTMDFGFMVDGYCSDMTRTVAVGEPSAKQRDVYQTVLRAQEAAFSKIFPGAVCNAVDKAARDLINAAYSGCFGHGLGHSLGLEVHEDPCFNESCEAALEPGMVLSVEPGIYLPGEFGVRVEDVIAVTADGFENLMKSPKQLIVL